MNALTLFDLFDVVEIDFILELFYECLEQILRQRSLHLAFVDKAKELIANLQFKVYVLLVLKMLGCRGRHIG